MRIYIDVYATFILTSELDNDSYYDLLIIEIFVYLFISYVKISPIILICILNNIAPNIESTKLMDLRVCEFMYQLKR